ncbi:hypothetical protein BDZ91DRAFT_768770 [Kalaharituber pfeilii]|nr:hypothetical protein BDZ91DRAFT_768770 [Kalaharituber pfeilii]
MYEARKRIQEQSSDTWSWHEATARGTPAQDTKGKGKTRVAPIELSTPIPSSPGNPGGMKSVVPCFDSLETTQFMNGAINASDWKGRIQVAWAQYFFVKRGLSADERKRCFHKFIPGELVSESKDLMAYYERTYSIYIEFLRGRVIKYGNMFFESPAGKLWMDELAIHNKETIDFYVTMLIHVKTEPVELGKIGWIADDEEGYWQAMLKDTALQLILLYVLGESKGRRTYSKQAMITDLDKITFNTADLPALANDIFDYSVLVNKHSTFPQPIVIRASSDMLGDDSSTETIIPGDEPEDLISAALEDIHEAAPTNEMSDVQCQEVVLDSIKQETFMEQSFREKVLKQDRDIIDPRGREFLHVWGEDHNTPLWYQTKVPNEYARMNIWGKHEVHRWVVNKHMQYLDGVIYDAICRKKTLQKDLDEEHEEMERLIEQKRKELANAQEGPPAKRARAIDYGISEAELKILASDEFKYGPDTE